MSRWDVQKYAREAYDMGIRYIGACCGFEPYHVRAIAEEVKQTSLSLNVFYNFRLCDFVVLHCIATEARMMKTFGNKYI